MLFLSWRNGERAGRGRGNKTCRGAAEVFLSLKRQMKCISTRWRGGKMFTSPLHPHCEEFSGLTACLGIAPTSPPLFERYNRSFLTLTYGWQVINCFTWRSLWKSQPDKSPSPDEAEIGWKFANMNSDRFPSLWPPRVWSELFSSHLSPSLKFDMKGRCVVHSDSYKQPRPPFSLAESDTLCHGTLRR